MPRKGYKQSPEHRAKHLEKIKGSGNGSWKDGSWKKRQYEYRLIHNRMRRRKHVGTFSVGEWERLKAQYGHQCPCCERGEPTIRLTIDHIIPISKGGKNILENIQPLCKSCNSRKYTKIVNFAPVTGVKRSP